MSVSDRPPTEQTLTQDEHEHEQQEHIVGPSPWPFGTAGGMALILFGLTTTLAFCALGAVIFVVSLAGWIGDMRRG